VEKEKVLLKVMAATAAVKKKLAIWIAANMRELAKDTIASIHVYSIVKALL
jgi:hypothetical protein